MKKVYDNCCGIDVHKKLMVACFIHGKEQEVREFGATTRELLELADWLVKGGCQMVAMESTASYWKPLYNILESSGLNAIVVNARHMKAVPGRKTDVKDSEWIADLAQHGLLQPSYIPDRNQRELRELVSYRRSLVQDRTRELNRLQKMLEGANIKLSGTITNINEKSTRNIIDTILSGTAIDSSKYDEMYDNKVIAHNLKASKEQIIDDLNGFMSPLQRKMMKEFLKHILPQTFRVCLSSPLISAITPRGHFTAHIPQLRHCASSITAQFSTTCTASAVHVFSQIPQPMQL